MGIHRLATAAATGLPPGCFLTYFYVNFQILQSELIVPMACSQEAPDLAPFTGWPLLPLRGGGLGALTSLEHSTTIRPGGGTEWTPALLDALEALGCRCSSCDRPMCKSQYRVDALSEADFMSCDGWALGCQANNATNIV